MNNEHFYAAYLKYQHGVEAHTKGAEDDIEGTLDPTTVALVELATIYQGKLQKAKQICKTGIRH